MICSVLDDYYYPSFHFCEPQEGVKKQSESLGSILFGDRIFNSPYDVCPSRLVPTKVIGEY
jgi:Endomembrane protein 70